MVNQRRKLKSRWLLGKRHKWKPSGIAENKYVEARCSICSVQVCSGANFIDSKKINNFWKELRKRKDCL